MRSKKLLLPLIIGIATVLWAIPKVGERYTYKVKISILSGQAKPLNMEMRLVQKVKAVGKDQSFIVEIAPQFNQPSQPSQKQSANQPTPFSLKVEKNGKATLLSNPQDSFLSLIPPEMLPSLAGILPIPSNFSKGKSFKVPMPNNPKSFLVFKHLGNASYKGKNCAKISLTIPKVVYSQSSPQTEMKMTLNGNGTFLTLPADNRILQGKVTMLIENKGYTYNQQKQKVSLDSKSTVNLEMEKL